MNKNIPLIFGMVGSMLMGFAVRQIWGGDGIVLLLGFILFMFYMLGRILEV